MNLLSKKIVSFLFVASLLFANGLAMEERQPTLEERFYNVCRGRNLKEVKVLLKHPKIDVNKGDGIHRWTPLHIACDSGHIEIVKILLKHPKIYVNKMDVYGHTPLYKACFQGHTEVVKVLLKNPGIDVNKRNKSGCTPLFVACWRGHLEVVNVLLAFGVDFRIRNGNEVTALDAAQARHDRQVIEALENPLVTTVCCPGPVGVETYIKMKFPFFDFHKKYEYKVGEETRNYFLIHIAELMLEEFEDDLSQIFLAKEKEIELRQNVVKIKKVINLLKTLLSSFRKKLKKARDGRKFCDCVVVVKII